MNNNITMRGKDALKASLAECFITVDGRRYNFMQLINFEARFETQTTELPILGRTGKANMTTGWTGTFSGEAYYNQSVIREMFEKFKDTGEQTYVEIQITNEDPNSNAGRQTVIFKDALINGGILAKFDADGDYLTEDINGTFDDFVIPTKFNLLDGMI